MFKTIINNFLVEFYPAISTDNNNHFSAYQEIYTVQSNQECIINICLNGGTCLIGIDNKSGCICTDSYTGRHHSQWSSYDF